MWIFGYDNEGELYGMNDNIPDFDLFADGGFLVASDGTNNDEFMEAAKAYAKERNIPVHFVKNGPVVVARYNHGFPANVPAFSESARQWAQMSGSYRKESERWNSLLEGRSC